MFLPTGEDVAQLLIRQGLASASHPQQKEEEDHPEEKEVFDEDEYFVDAKESLKIFLSPMSPSPREELSHPEEGVLISKYQLLDFPLGWKEFLAEVPCIETPNLVGGIDHCKAMSGRDSKHNRFVHMSAVLGASLW